MLIMKIWYFFVGYIAIEIEGLSLEKFMNITVLDGIYMWDLKRTSPTTLIACIGIKDFKRIRQIQKKVRCRISIVDKRGLPFVIHRLKRRKGFITGLFMFLVLIYVISSFIWVVEIEGLEHIEEELIRHKLNELGINRGVFKGTIDVSHIENRMMIEIPDISWISIELRGTKAVVRLVETVKPPDILDIDKPCNIVASKAGIIHKMIVLEGYPIVKEGDMVEAGELLVSGIADYADTTGIRYVHAMGNILARTWYEVNVETCINDFRYEKTGKIVKCKYIKLGDYIMDFIVEPIPFDKYEVKEQSELFFGEGKFIPLELLVREYHELEPLSYEVAVKKAKEEAQALVSTQIEQSIPDDGKIIDKTYKYDIIERERIKCTAYIEVLEDIGREEEIIINREEMPIEESS